MDRPPQGYWTREDLVRGVLSACEEALDVDGRLPTAEALLDVMLPPPLPAFRQSAYVHLRYLFVTENVAVESHELVDLDVYRKFRERFAGGKMLLTVPCPPDKSRKRKEDRFVEWFEIVQGERSGADAPRAVFEIWAANCHKPNLHLVLNNVKRTEREWADMKKASRDKQERKDAKRRARVESDRLAQLAEEEALLNTPAFE